MIHPFFDISNLSDDELDKKYTDLSQKLYQAYSVSGNFLIVDQLRNLLDIIQNEARERSFKQNFQLINERNSNIIETDPLLAEEEKSEENKETYYDNFIPERLKKEEKVYRINDRQEKFKQWQDEQKSSLSEKNNLKQPAPIKKRGRPRKVRPQ